MFQLVEELLFMHLLSAVALVEKMELTALAVLAVVVVQVVLHLVLLHLQAL
jgi:hypothetical protein